MLRRKRGNYPASMSIVQRYWILASINRILIPILLYCIYLAVGPWVICEIIDKHYGIVFAWGIYLDGTYFPPQFTCLYGISEILFCQIPMVWIYSKYSAKRYYEAIGMPTKNHCGCLCSTKYPFYIVIGLEILATITFGLFYSAFGYIIGVSRTYSIILNIYLWYTARYVPDYALR